MRMSLGSPKKNTTAAQRFKKLFDLCMDESAPQGERDSAKRKADAWLKQHQKSWRDASSILARAAADDAAAAPPPLASTRRYCSSIRKLGILPGRCGHGHRQQVREDALGPRPHYLRAVDLLHSRLRAIRDCRDWRWSATNRTAARPRQ